MVRFNRLLKDLESQNSDVQEAALEQIEKRTLSAKQGVLVIAAATQQYPNDEGRHKSLSAELLRGCWKTPRPQYVAAIEEHYEGLSKDDEGCWQSLRVLTELKTSASLEVFVRLLKHPTIRCKSLEMALVPLVGSGMWAGRDADPVGTAMFPGFFDAIDNLEGANDIESAYRCISKYHSAELIAVGDYPEFVERCVGRANQCLDILPEWERWMRDKEFHESLSSDETGTLHRSVTELEWVLDLLRHMNHAEIPAVLRRSLSSGVANIRLFAISSALASDISVDDEVLHDLAKEPGLRYRLLALLYEIGRTDRFPATYFTQPLLAEAEMVHWLEFPTELGWPPDEIELLTTIPHRSDDQNAEPGELYLFKFLHKDEWLVGVAGPYPADGPPRIGGRATFSRFKKLDSKPLEEHVKDYLEEEEEE